MAQGRGASHTPKRVRSGSRKGLQLPGDAQEISLDFTLVDPVTAENHLRTILQGFLQVVGIIRSRRSFTRRLSGGSSGQTLAFLAIFCKCSQPHSNRRAVRTAQR